MQKLLTLTIALLVAIGMSADNKLKRPESYNYNRAMEALGQHNQAEALEYLNKELADNPKNGYAQVWLAFIHYGNEEYEQALTAANTALKYIPKKDDEYVGFAYQYRAKVYLCLKDTASALNDYAAAIKVAPEDEDYLYERAQIYYELDKYDLADADYERIIKNNPTSVTGYMGKGRNRNAQQRWDEAIEMFTKVIALDADYSSAYSFRAKAYLGKQMWAEATDDLVMAMSIDGEEYAFEITSELEEPAAGIMLTKLDIQYRKEPNNHYWPYCIGVLLEKTGQYAKAIESYEQSSKLEPLDVTYHRLSSCYSELGDYDKAIEFIDRAIEMNSTEWVYRLVKTLYLTQAGRLE